MVCTIYNQHKKNVYNKYYDTNNLKFLTNLFKNHYKKSTIAAGAIVAFLPATIAVPL